MYVIVKFAVRMWLVETFRHTAKSKQRNTHTGINRLYKHSTVFDQSFRKSPPFQFIHDAAKVACRSSRLRPRGRGSDDTIHEGDASSSASTGVEEHGGDEDGQKGSSASTGDEAHEGSATRVAFSNGV